MKSMCKYYYYIFKDLDICKVLLFSNFLYRVCGNYYIEEKNYLKLFPRVSFNLVVSF